MWYRFIDMQLLGVCIIHMLIWMRTGTKILKYALTAFVLINAYNICLTYLVHPDKGKNM